MQQTIALLVFLVLQFSSVAQLHVTSQVSPDTLLQKTLLSESSSLKIIEVKYTGHKSQLGYFKTEFSDYIDIKEGVILATGEAINAIGPNNSSRITGNLQGNGDADLTRIAKNRTEDACILEFTFIPEGSHFEFQYVFASEEYPEYVNHGVNDVFAFILTDLETGKRKNLAFLPISKEAVTVDNVNSIKNSEYFILNGRWIKGENQKYVEEKELGEYAYNFQYDGFTTWLKAESMVVPGQRYSLKIAIADAGDGAYDSAVLLKRNSFKSETDIAKNMKKEMDELIRYFDAEHVIQRNDSLVLILNIQFEHDKSEIVDEIDLENLEEIYQVISRNPKLFLLIEGFTDSKGKVEYNKTLSEKRANEARKWLINKGLGFRKVSSLGKGMADPIASNQSEVGRTKNRRVEFVFYLKE
jgi:outer membrane protein OmpA-like peptidoglycan-associated protein|tara:strand:- start:1081 stop:2319 length:1239 start_codon:yes stop_codon:yes gene_type:complete